MEELWELNKLGIHNIHMYADLFTIHREQVVELCKLIIAQGLKIRWTCNSRVDYVDEEMLQLMGRAGCWFISWGIESGNEQILKRAHKGAYPDKAERALRWAKKAGIANWGYFIIGLPGETEVTIRETIEFAKKLPLDIALFHVAAPYPGTPFFFEVVKEGWFRPGTRWEQVDEGVRREVQATAIRTFARRLRKVIGQLAELRECVQLPGDHARRRRAERALLQKRARLEQCIDASMRLA